MKLSIELEILIESIKVRLLAKSTEKLHNLIINPKVNWLRVEKLVIFHAIRPVVYDAFQKIGFENDFTKKIKLRAFTQSVVNLSTSHELARLLTLLQNQNIRVLPYKGLLFTHEFYNNQPLRENHDLDLLVHPNDARKALKILVNDGYTPTIAENSKLINDELIDTMYNTFGLIEIGLDKKTNIGTDIHIDFHWQLFEGFHNFQIDFKDFFKQQELREYFGKNVYFPKKEIQFLMLLNHHGGREAWCRLKHFCDLIAFQKTYSFSEKDLLNLSTNVAMKKNFEVGLSIYETLFHEKPPASTLLKIESKIINYWETGELWLKLSNRWHFEHIKFLLDDNFDLKKRIWYEYTFFSTPNIIENPRLITFPHQFRFLNFCSKVITFIWKSFRPSFFSK